MLIILRTETNLQNNNSDLLSVVIISYNTSLLTCKAIQSVITYANDICNEIIIVDNNSTDNSVIIIKEKFPEVAVLENNTNLGFAKAANIGINAAKNRYVLLLNSDAELIHNIRKPVLELVKHEFGLATPQLINEDGSWQRSYGFFPGIKSALYNLLGINWLVKKVSKLYFDNGNSDKTQEVEYCDGAALFLDKKNSNIAGFFDEDYFFYTEEVQLAFSLQKLGIRRLFTPEIKVQHLRNENTSSIKYYHLIGSKVLFLQKNKPRTVLFLYLIIEILFYFELYCVKKILRTESDYYRHLIEIHKKFLKEIFFNQKVD